jgi:hypothetical protein
MNKAGGIIGIVAGIFGFFAAVITLSIGGVGQAVSDVVGNTETGKAAVDSIVGFGYAGIVSSFAVIVFGALAFARPRLAGIGLLIFSILGIIYGGSFVAVCMALSLLGGIFSLFGRDQKKGQLEQRDLSVDTGKNDSGQKASKDEIKKELKILAVMIPMVVIGVVVYTKLISPKPEIQPAAIPMSSPSNDISSKQNLSAISNKTSSIEILEQSVEENQTIDTNAGIFSLNKDGDTPGIYLDGIKIKEGADSMSFGFKTKYVFGDWDAILAVDGKSATCQLYFFITSRSETNVEFSPSFGTCDDNPEITKQERKIIIKMLSQQGKKETYFYENGVVSDNCKQHENTR